jgi:hypothetical protein
MKTAKAGPGTTQPNDKDRPWTSGLVTGRECSTQPMALLLHVRFAHIKAGSNKAADCR